ncbi:DUF5994 family protein [Streptacidiphilus rugosus]|uniref:DUF5994 family protein n=1 Tax=Streptacidiphilus rugosus TaxID=405783 RepID=UPI0009FEEC0B|nr:DUF5994 family protein [Streptacidiphilus rugosus]
MRVDALGAPLLPRLLLEPTMSRTGMFDGAWWPHSNRIRVELPDLITALTAHLGPIARVGLDIVPWDDVPRTVMADGRLIRISWFASSDRTISITRGFQDHFLLLVIPPSTDARTASDAMTAAAAQHNHTAAGELLP